MSRKGELSFLSPIQTAQISGVALEQFFVLMIYRKVELLSVIRLALSFNRYGFDLYFRDGPIVHSCLNLSNSLNYIQAISHFTEN